MRHRRDRRAGHGPGFRCAPTATELVELEPNRWASSIRIVFTRGMSRPLSTIVVQSITPASPALKATMALSSSPSAIWPCATSSLNRATSPAIQRQRLRCLPPSAPHKTPDLHGQFLTDCAAHRFRIQSNEVGLDRSTQGGGVVIHLPNTRQTHVERPWNPEGQYIDVLAQHLDLFLLVHAKALLFIHNQQSNC